MQLSSHRTLGFDSGIISTHNTSRTEMDFWHLLHFVSTNDRSRLFTGGIVRLISATGGGEVGTSLVIVSLFSAGDRLISATGGGEVDTSLMIISLFSAGDMLFSPSGSSISVRQAKGLGEVNWLVTISSYCSSSDEL